MSRMERGLLEMRACARSWRKILTENRNYWAEVAAEDEDASRLRAIGGIPLDELERCARFYWADKEIDFDVYGGDISV